MGLLANTVNGHYTASRGYDEEDLHLPTVVMRVEGPGLLDVMHQGGGMPSVSYVQKVLQYRKVKFWTCAMGDDTPIREALVANVACLAATIMPGHSVWTLRWMRLPSTPA